MSDFGSRMQGHLFVWLFGSPDLELFIRGQEKLAPFNYRDTEELRMRSPLAFAEHFKCPVRAYYGDKDSWFAPQTKAMADRLFAAAPEPKKQVWYDNGHFLGAQAYEDAAQWIAETVGKAKAQSTAPQRKAG